MPLLFSYGTLQDETVQVSTVGRRLDGQPDALPGFEPSTVRIEDPELVARLQKTHHANVTFIGKEESRVSGTALEVTDAELKTFDEFEASFFYERVSVRLVSGRAAWVYVHQEARASTR
jgi:hypothetical protein